VSALRDQLDQIARLEETLAQSQTLCTVAEFMTARAKSNEALGNFWRSGGRELAEDGMKWRAHKEKLEEMQKLKAIAVAARAKEEKDVG
jgi:hypothetical protein